MAGLNLEVFKCLCSQPQFGVYVMFPIGIMYYFGTNLDQRFSVPGFWPQAEESHRFPRSRDELKVEYDKLVARQRLRQQQKQLQQQQPPPANHQASSSTNDTNSSGSR